MISTGDVVGINGQMTDDGSWWVTLTLSISGTLDRARFQKLLGCIAEACKGGAISLQPKSFTAEGDRIPVET